MNRRLVVLALGLCLGLGAVTTSAQRTLTVEPAATNEQRVALVIGNATYKDAPLRNPANDAADMAAELRRLGFAVTLRTNSGPREMRAAIREFSQSLRKGGVGLFYFAGHGVQSKGRNYLIPVNADIREEFELEDEAVDANRVLAGMEEAGNRVNIVILDACRNNPFARSWRSAASGLAQMSAPAGSFVAFATAPGSVAADGSGRNGVFTENLLKSLREPDSDIDRVFTRVTAGVARTTANKQVPWKSSSLTGEFRFRGGDQVANAAPATAAISVDPGANDRAFWESVKDTKSADELRAYLRRFPEGMFAELAQTRLRAQEAPPVSPPAVPAPLIASAAPTAEAIQQATPPGSIASKSPGTVFRDCDVCPEMVVIPSGSFLMGSPVSEPGRELDEGPQHTVTIARPFAAGKYEVTFDEWDACVREGGCSHNPSDNGWGKGRRPAINVSWQDAKMFTGWLSRKSGKVYRLLTEAEWEYVARAGTTTAFSFGNSITPQQANYDGDYAYAGGVTGVYRDKTVEVGTFQPNAFGLYDVHGNVREWTEDCRNENYNGAPSNGSAWMSGRCDMRVLRGGSWINRPAHLRSAYRAAHSIHARSSNAPFNRGDYGFRVARSDTSVPAVDPQRSAPLIKRKE